MATFDQLFQRVGAAGDTAPLIRPLAIETPVAIEINGLSYAVLMATPQDLIDMAYGFLLTERLIDGPDEVIGVEWHKAPAGIILRVTVGEVAFARTGLRVRHRTSEGSCGLCGIENLEQALRPLPHLARSWKGSDAAVFAALARLKGYQPLNNATGAVHAAVRCSADGDIVDVREDVGRHNAFDKLIGAMLVAAADWDDGFGLLTSRCSYELVEKAVLSGCPMLATISAPTDLAVQRAAEAGLALRVLARPDALLAILP